MASETLAQQAVENVVKESKESGSDPPPAILVNGTTNSPHDGGNLPETTTQPGIEPPSGQKGAGTTDDPYEQGNDPGTHPSLTRISNNVDNASRTRSGPGRSVISPGTTDNTSNIPSTHQAMSSILHPLASQNIKDPEPRTRSQMLRRPKR